MTNSVRAAAIVGAVMLPVATSCGGDLVGPELDGEYTLIAIGPAALPAQHPFSTMLEIVAGSLTVRPDGSLQERTTVRCRSNLPPGTECSVQQPETVRTGTYSVAEGVVRIGGSAYTTAFTRTRIVIEYPPASLDAPPASFEYRR